MLLNLLTLLLTSSFVLLPLVWLRPPDPGPALNFSECLAHRGNSDSEPTRTLGWSRAQSVGTALTPCVLTLGIFLPGSSSGTHTDRAFCLLTHPQGPAQASLGLGLWSREGQRLPCALETLS